MEDAGGQAVGASAPDLEASVVLDQHLEGPAVVAVLPLDAENLAGDDQAALGDLDPSGLDLGHLGQAAGTHLRVSDHASAHGLDGLLGDIAVAVDPAQHVSVEVAVGLPALVFDAELFQVSDLGGVCGLEGVGLHSDGLSLSGDLVGLLSPLTEQRSPAVQAEGLVSAGVADSDDLVSGAEPHEDAMVKAGTAVIAGALALEVALDQIVENVDSADRHAENVSEFVVGPVASVGLSHPGRRADVEGPAVVVCAGVHRCRAVDVSPCASHAFSFRVLS